MYFSHFHITILSLSLPKPSNSSIFSSITDNPPFIWSSLIDGIFLLHFSFDLLGFFFLKFHFFQCFHVRSNLFHTHIIVLISCSCLFVSSLNLFHLTSILFISFNTIRVILLNGFHIMYSIESLLWNLLFLNDILLWIFYVLYNTTLRHIHLWVFHWLDFLSAIFFQW